VSGWKDTPGKRRKDAAAYGTPEYRRNRELARRRANGHCEQCHHRHPKLQCDHIAPKSQTSRPDSSLSNLQMLCTGPGSCRCHDKKTYEQRTASRKTRAADPPCTPRTKW
jgi:hypothetical protein